MRIAIDMQGVQTGSKFRGIGRYTHALVKSMLGIRSSDEIYLFFNSKLGKEALEYKALYKSLVNVNMYIREWTPYGSVSEFDAINDENRIFAENYSGIVFSAVKPDIVIYTSCFEGYGENFVSVIMPQYWRGLKGAIFYDLIPLRYPNEYLGDPRVRELYEKKVEKIRKTDFLLAISESSAGEALDLLGFSDGRVCNISSATGDFFYRIVPSEVTLNHMKELGIAGEFILYVSASDSRKNHKNLIKAYSELSPKLRVQHKLVLAGAIHPAHKIEFEDAIDNLGVRDDVLIVAGLNDELLRALYSSAYLFVFPSRHEGFGLPVLEAMNCDCPVIGSDRSSIPEIIGLKAAMFNPDDCGEIASIIERALTDKIYYSELLDNSRMRRTMFDWDVSAKKAFEFIRARARNFASENTYPNVLEYYSDEISSCIPSYGDSEFLEISEIINNDIDDDSLREPTIYIDVSFAIKTDLASGIQRVVRCVAKELSRLDLVGYKIRMVEVDFNADSKYRVLGSVYEEFRAGAGVHFDLMRGDIFLGLDLLPPSVINWQLPWFREARHRGALVYFVVYDILPIKFPEFFPRAVPKGFRAWIGSVLEFDGLIAISKSVQDDIKFYMSAKCGDYPCLISNFLLGVDKATFRTVPVARIRDEVLRFVAVGTVEPRKGYAQIIEAISILHKKNVKIELTIVGKRGWNVDSLMERQLGAQCVKWISDADDNFVVDKLNSSDCLIAASHDEGFGLPLIEAASCGLPVIARNIKVFREVLGSGGFYFDGDSAEDLSSAIQDWINLYRADVHPRLSPDLVPSWRESAISLLKSVRGFSI